MTGGGLGSDAAGTGRQGLKESEWKAEQGLKWIIIPALPSIL